ncbi:MAG: response regulator transcription factor [Eubacteriales bacterium]|nr:response regulator transcription factor [Eubacteriales bacterium]
MPYTILVIDDETMLTDLLREHLQNNGYTVYTANDAQKAIALLRYKPNLILLDINMPEMDGLELCKNIRSHVVCPILFLTARITEQDKVNGLMAGGDDYITKPFSLAELTARIAAHLRRDERNKNAPDVVASQGLLVNLFERSLSFNGQNIPVSKREFDLIEFLMTNANQVFDKERIYESVWGYDAEGDSNVIKEYVRKIRAKLYQATGNDYIETVWGVGYKWVR